MGGGRNGKIVRVGSANAWGFIEPGRAHAPSVAGRQRRYGNFENTHTILSFGKKDGSGKHRKLWWCPNAGMPSVDSDAKDGEGKKGRRVLGRNVGLSTEKSR